MPTKEQAYEAIAKGLRNFGYPDVSARMVADVHKAMQQGDDEMPHDIVGMFAKAQLEELADEGVLR